MTDFNYTHIFFLVDSSESMRAVSGDVIAGFNKFLSEQKEVQGSKCTFSQAHFSSGLYSRLNSPLGSVSSEHPLNRETVHYKVHNDFTDIKDVQPLSLESFLPGGGTPLYDSIGQAIITTGEKLAALPEALRPGKVLFVIFTDGEENTSTKFKSEQISGMIRHQEGTYNWAFQYLGANHDAIAAARKIGIGPQRAARWSYGATGQAVGAMSATVSASRNAATMDQYLCSVNYSDDQRRNMVSADDQTLPANYSVHTGSLTTDSQNP